MECAAYLDGYERNSATPGMANVSTLDFNTFSNLSMKINQLNTIFDQGNTSRDPSEAEPSENTILGELA